jgi:hypothetical protein
VGVDIRYALWVLDMFEHADALLEELQVVPARRQTGA